MPIKHFEKLALGGLVLSAATAVAGLSSAATPSEGATLTYLASTVVVTATATSATKPSSQLSAALEAFRSAVAPLSDARALEDAFRSYFAFKATHPERVKKPLLYFVDYGLPSTTPRGYVFNMETLSVVDGPFMVAHGRGSSATRDGVPTRFSNVMGSAATSLGLYVAQELYAFTGKAAGQRYSSVGLRLEGVSPGHNDNARLRGVVAHGAPYVSARGAGRSEGCPAVDPERAERLLPLLAEGALVFLFAPDREWLQRDRWVTASAE